ncbi:unnamed protein product [Anisakis simplex]|uniref:RRM domain-containing protein n=1 Tax=Anisakis simplex TaxID=6269 RepID=A0A0M3J7I7_ANISI|nr:unnamed protein product [Anisakis simplex]
MDESDLKMEEVDKDVKMETETAEGEGSSSETPKALKRRPKLHSKSRGSSKALKDPEGRSKVIKISHLPFGFFEEELFKYFKQFGYVRRVRVARSLKVCLKPVM